MGYQGYLYMSANDPSVNALECAKAFARLYGVRQFWLDRHRMVGGPTIKPLYVDWKDRLRWMLGIRKFHLGVAVSEPDEITFQRSSWAEVQAAWLEPLALAISFDSDHWKDLEQEMRGTIPESVHGGFIPCGLACIAGWHEVLDALGPTDSPCSRHRFSVRLMGHGTPRDRKTFTSILLGLPSVQAIQRDAERIAGPITTRLCFR